MLSEPIYLCSILRVWTFFPGTQDSSYRAEKNVRDGDDAFNWFFDLEEHKVRIPDKWRSRTSLRRALQLPCLADRTVYVTGALDVHGLRTYHRRADSEVKISCARCTDDGRGSSMNIIAEIGSSALVVLGDAAPVDLSAHHFSPSSCNLLRRTYNRRTTPTVRLFDTDAKCCKEVFSHSRSAKSKGIWTEEKRPSTNYRWETPSRIRPNLQWAP